jgi:hypothetical protein
MSTISQYPWSEMGDASDEASGIIRIKTPSGWVDATEQDISLGMGDRVPPC